MPKVSEEFLLARREEIIDACAKLYETMSFKEVTLKEIGQVTTFNRTAIYNYFNTKEEIFLALMQREYECWTRELDELIKAHEQMTRDELARALAHSLEKRERLLKLLSMNHFDMEENSRYENLVEFKKAYGESIRAVGRCLDKFCPEMNEKDKEEFLYVYFPFMYGIYPYAVVTEKQRKAMEDAGVGFVYHSVYELSYNCLKKLLVKGES
ncbi:MAG: TetR/AcrR family transcriptional regulator [Selenomonadaceae bacterium]|nr:TetR/AcrR family transcriptional regulator [Selenomonadaceae bacterium]MBQ1511321.1 TetR/AcrR family transcriptional regulator [Selenomonadaceae bacterium]